LLEAVAVHTQVQVLEDIELEQLQTQPEHIQ
jgi:hypothetical protein